jgi:hypothetical protein
MIKRARNSSIIMDMARKSKTMREFLDRIAEKAKSLGKVSFTERDAAEILRMYGFCAVEEVDKKIEALRKSDSYDQDEDPDDYVVFNKSYNDIAYEAYIYPKEIHVPFPTDVVLFFDDVNLKAILKEIRGLSIKHSRLFEQADQKFTLIEQKYSTEQCLREESVYRASYLEGVRYSEQEREKKFPCFIKRNKMLDEVWETPEKVLTAFRAKYGDFLAIVEEKSYYVEGFEDEPAGVLFEGCHSLEETRDFCEFLWRYNRMVFMQAGARPEYVKGPGRKGYPIEVVLNVQEEFRKKYEKFHLIHLEIPRKGFTHISQSEEKRLAEKHGVVPDIVHSIARRGAWETALEYTAIQFHERIPKYQVYKIIKSKRYKIVI